MAHSMTAFARSQQEAGGLVLGWELRSVNHRYLEIQFRIPEPLRGIEPALRDVLRTHLKRGKVDCTLRADASGAAASGALNRPLLEQVAALIQEVRTEVPGVTAPGVMDLLRWPGMLAGGADLGSDTVAETAEDLFEEALADLLDHRAREGAQLVAGISARLDDIDRLVGEIKHHTAAAPVQLQQRLRQRLDELRSSVNADRLEQELALLAQRSDVAEELDRLVIHVEEMRTSLRGSGPHGRRLDFLAQELNREANTLGAKSVLAQISQRTVDLKVVIEQIREQVQNLE